MSRTNSILATAVLAITGCWSQSAPESDFWKWFQQNEARLFDFELNQESTFNRLASEMQKVHPSLTFEFSPKNAGVREFVISADGIRDAFPKVESLYAAAPKLTRWKFIKFRPRRDPFDLEYKGVLVKANTVSVLIQKDGPKAGLTVCIPGYSEKLHDTYTGIAFLLLDQALGEFDVETRVGFINVQAPNPSSIGAQQLKALPKAFDQFLSSR